MMVSIWVPLIIAAPSAIFFASSNILRVRS